MKTPSDWLTIEHTRPKNNPWIAWLNGICAGAGLTAAIILLGEPFIAKRADGVRQPCLTVDSLMKKYNGPWQQAGSETSWVLYRDGTGRWCATTTNPDLINPELGKPTQ